MAIIKNPFRKQDENARPQVVHVNSEQKEANGAKQIDVDVKQPTEYKLSEVNDSGVFMPPSPTEKKTFWGGTTASRSTTSSSLHRCAFDENEPFNISRESFDSYRRSFDISARSPVIQPLEGRPRVSLDSRTFQPPRSSNSFHRPLQVPQTQEEDKFEDVNIDDPKPQPKKRGLFARMADSVPGVGNDSAERPASQQDKSSWHHFGGRKRGQSGQGSELGAIPIPKRDETPKPEKQQQRGPSQAQPQPAAKTEGVKTEPTKTEVVKTEPVKTEPVKTAAVKAEAVKTEPVKKEAVKAEAAKTETAQTPEVKSDS